MDYICTSNLVPTIDVAHIYSMVLQPLFPGENAVDQLVEIIKVHSNHQFLNYAICIIMSQQLTICLVGSWHTNT